MSFDEETPFPGLSALAPCLGAALCLHAGRAPRIGQLLDNPLMRFCGRVSYSAYLVHWPLYVFYRQALFRPLSQLEGFGFLIVCFGLATLSYFYVEEKFRNPREGANRRFLIYLGTAAVGLASMTIALRYTSFRIREGADLFAGVTKEEVRNIRDELNRSLPDQKKKYYRGKVSKNKLNVMILGNSHVPDGLNMMHAALGEEVNYLVSWQGSCPPYHPSETNRLNPRMEHRPDCEKRLKAWLNRPGFPGGPIL